MGIDTTILTNETYFTVATEKRKLIKLKLVISTRRCLEKRVEGRTPSKRASPALESVMVVREESEASYFPITSRKMMTTAEFITTG